MLLPEHNAKQLLMMEAHVLERPTRSLVLCSRMLSALCGARYLGILESPEAKVLRFYKQLEPTDVVPQMRPSQQLDALIQPGSRLGPSSAFTQNSDFDTFAGLTAALLSPGARLNLSAAKQ